MRGGGGTGCHPRVEFIAARVSMGLKEAWQGVAAIARSAKIAPEEVVG